MLLVEAAGDHAILDRIDARGGIGLSVQDRINAVDDRALRGVAEDLKKLLGRSSLKECAKLIARGDEQGDHLLLERRICTLRGKEIFIHGADACAAVCIE